MLGLLFVAGVIKLPAAVTPTGQIIGQPTPIAAGELLCAKGSNPTINLGVVVANPLTTTTTLYSAATVSAYDGAGTVVGTVTSTAGTTASYGNIAVTCNAQKLQGSVYVLSGTSAPGTLVNSVKQAYDMRQSLGDQKIIAAPNVTALQMTIRNTGLVNTSETIATVNSANETAATAMVSGDPRSGYFDIQGNTANSQFGSDDGGLLWVIDTADSTVFSDKALSLSSTQISLQEVACPQVAISYDSGNRCYRSGPIRTTDGLIRLSWALNADLGNPGTSADPLVYIEDVQYFEQDGVVVQGIYNKGGTNVGVARQQFRLDNS